MCYRKWIVLDSDDLTQAERPIESWSDLVECVREIFEENKRSFWFWSSLVMMVFLYLLLCVVD